MKKLSITFVFCFLAILAVNAQKGQKQQKPQMSESKEILADRHLEQEIQQKQLSAKPIPLHESQEKSEANSDVVLTKKHKTKRPLKRKL